MVIRPVTIRRGSLKFDGQSRLKGVPSGLRLNVGYHLDRDETQMTGIFVVWSIGKQTLWSARLDGAGVQPEQISLPVSTTDQAQPRRTKIKDKAVSNERRGKKK